MVSEMIRIIEGNKLRRILSELDQYDPEVVTAIENLFEQMALGESRDWDISKIMKEKDEAFCNQFKDLTGKLGYFVTTIRGMERWFLSTLPIGK